MSLMAKQVCVSSREASGASGVLRVAFGWCVGEELCRSEMMRISTENESQGFSCRRHNCYPSFS